MVNGVCCYINKFGDISDFGYRLSPLGFEMRLIGNY